jgi:hypothetical protein
LQSSSFQSSFFFEFLPFLMHTAAAAAQAAIKRMM